MVSKYILHELVEYLPDEGKDTYTATYLGSIPALVTRETHQSIHTASQTLNEVLRLVSLSHPNICRVYDCFVEEDRGNTLRTVVITEQFEKLLSVEIARRRRRNEYFTELELLQALAALAEALSVAQLQGIPHKNIRPASIFITDNMYKFAVFSFSKLRNPSDLVKFLQRSLPYLSPEARKMYIKLIETQQIPSEEYDLYKSDVYSLAVTVAEMTLLQCPVELNAVLENPAVVNTLLNRMNFHPKLVTLLRKMLDLIPENRPSFPEIVAEGKMLISESMSPLPSQPHSLNSTIQPVFQLSPDASYCVICKQIVQDSSWIDTRMIHDPYPVPDVCSLDCYEIWKGKEAGKCMLCFKAIPWSSPNAVRTECDHQICSMECLFENAKKRFDRQFFSTGIWRCLSCRKPTSCVQIGAETVTFADYIAKRMSPL